MSGEGGRAPSAAPAAARPWLAPRTRWLWLAGYVVSTFLAFPQPVGEHVLDLGLPLAFAPLLCLRLGLRGLPPRRALRLGFLAGLFAHAAVLHWIYVVTVFYGHAWPPVGVVAVFGLAAYVACFPALFGLGAAWLDERGSAGPFVLAALWVASEHLRSFALTGFPWATLGYALHLDAPLVGLATLTGVYGLSFAAALGGASLAALLLGRRRVGLAGLAAVAALHGVGALLQAASAWEGEAPRVRVAALQGNVDQGVKWDPVFAERTLAGYEELTRGAAAQGATLVVWPETAVPGSPDADPELRARLAALAVQAGATLVVGAVGLDGFDPQVRARSPDLRFFDSAFVLAPEPGGEPLRYDKTHLVPFGEYVPLRDLVGRFVSAVATGIASGDVTAGPRPRALALPMPAGEPPLPAGVPICYELLFPDLMRGFAEDGARVLLAITNDAWYGRTGAPHQFLAMTAMRSAESRLWTVRAANTGVTALIDARGRVRAQTRVFTRDALVGEVELAPEGAAPTFYVRYGDVFAWTCWLAAAAAALWALGRSRGRRGGSDG